MFGAIAGGIASALAGGAMSKLFGGGQKAASGGIDRKSGSAGMPRPISYAVFCLKKKKKHTNNNGSSFEATRRNTAHLGNVTTLVIDTREDGARRHSIQ